MRRGKVKSTMANPSLLRTAAASASVVLLSLSRPARGFTLPSSARRVGVGALFEGGGGEVAVTPPPPLNLDEDEAAAVESTEGGIPSDPANDGGVCSLDDIIRDLDGDPLTKDYFAEKMGIENVDSYVCPEKDVFRGFMSNACRVQLEPGGETSFYKSIVFEELDHAREKLRTSPHKLVRDVQSYKVVASFLKSKACEEVTNKAGVHIPKCFDAQARPDYDDPMKSKFSFLFEDLTPWDGWYQQWLLVEEEECKAALTMLAKIHAFFWDGSTFWNDEDAAEELEEAVWECGSYIQPKAQILKGGCSCELVAKEWETKRLKFEKELSSFDCWDNLGERLESVAKECGRHAHPFADDELARPYRKYRTFTHGDPKQANLFFRQSEGSELEVGLIDFQWSGFGLAATDVAHFITSAIHADRLVDGGEEALLQYYYAELEKYLVEYGAFDTKEDVLRNFSRDLFAEQYDTAFLDLFRLVVSYTWDRFTEPVEKDDEAGCARTMNKTSYNKSLPNVVWLTSRCDEILRSRGV
mmetsp:Transcript_52209/g.110958  ORF Transcript_52209/g.110958 Transcript_52209/m.110958 type:complete len:527 (-) Transcript_52209:197-1777(-)